MKYTCQLVLYFQKDTFYYKSKNMEVFHSLK